MNYVPRIWSQFCPIPPIWSVKFNPIHVNYETHLRQNLEHKPTTYFTILVLINL